MLMVIKLSRRRRHNMIMMVTWANGVGRVTIFCIRLVALAFRLFEFFNIVKVFHTSILHLCFCSFNLTDLVHIAIYFYCGTSILLIITCYTFFYKSTLLTILFSCESVRVTKKVQKIIILYSFTSPYSLF